MEDKVDSLSIKIASVLVISCILVFISLVGLFIKAKDLRKSYYLNIEVFKKQIKNAQDIAITSSNVQRYSSNLTNLKNPDDILTTRNSLDSNRALLSRDMFSIKNFNVDSAMADSLFNLEKEYLKVNQHFLSLIDSGKTDEARTYSRSVRRVVYERFQNAQKDFFNELSDKTTMSGAESIWNFNIFWLLLVIGLLPLSAMFVTVIFFFFRIILGEIIGI